MKTRILSTLSLKNCKKELRTIKKISSINYIFKNKKNIYKSLKNIKIYISSTSIKVDKKFLENAKKLKAIFSPSTGTDHLDLVEIKKRGIKLFHIAN